MDFGLIVVKGKSEKLPQHQRSKRNTEYKDKEKE